LLEGWIAFLVAVEDRRTLMSFGNDYRRYWGLAFTLLFKSMKETED